LQYLHGVRYSPDYSPIKNTAIMKKPMLTLCLSLLAVAGYANPDPAASEAAAGPQMVTLTVSYSDDYRPVANISYIFVSVNGTELFLMADQSESADIQVPANSDVRVEFYGSVVNPYTESHGVEIYANGQCVGVMHRDYDVVTCSYWVPGTDINLDIWYEDGGF
jgi:hypothetical protein